MLWIEPCWWNWAGSWCRLQLSFGLVLLTKYGLDNTKLPPDLPSRYGSCLWKSMGKVWNDTRMGIRWNIGDGNKVRFWWDCWVTKSQPLYISIPDDIINKTVADFVDDNGNWNWLSLSHFLPYHVLLRIASIHPPVAVRGEDQVYWRESPKGIFTVKSTYYAISRHKNNGN